ncbi:T9SS type A sorting domain-containing protein [Aquimarina sp. 2304DJ70-9]|uniref:T9SS type A sorting domain-containing protein n=1 Tax=Aquimarina penaris TaxID=3231044 RepID=UPI0034630467
MKKLLLVFIVLFISSGIYAQDYTIEVKGYIGMAGSSCGSSRGLMSVTLFFADGTEKIIIDNPSGLANDNYAATYVYDDSNPVTGVEFYTKRRKDKIDCKRKHTRLTVPVNGFCSDTRYAAADVHGSFPGWANIAVYPNTGLSYDGVTSPYTVCVTGSVNIFATDGFATPDDIYRWEYFDTIGTKEIEARELTRLKQAVEDAIQDLADCLEEPGANCRFFRVRLRRAQDELAAYSGPLTEIVPFDGWKEITNKRGQSNIDLLLNDLYPNAADREQAINKNIRVRFGPGCFDYGEMSVIYLPEPPVVTKVDVIQPKCSDSQVGEIELYLDRQIYPNERIDITLEKKNQTGDYEVKDANVGIQSFVEVNPSTYRYTWVSALTADLTAGEYRLIVSGYEKDDVDQTPFCAQFIHDFEIKAPTPVKFTSDDTQPICADGTGSIKVTASGGTLPGGKYQFALTGGLNTGWKSPIPDTNNTYTFSNLDSEKNYIINVRLTNGTDSCEGTGQNPTDTNISISKPANTIKIQSASINENPSYPGASNGAIDVILKTGTTARPPFTYEAFLGSSLQKSETTSNSSTTLNGLIKGEYTIKITDDNGCSDTFATKVILTDTDAITIEDIIIDQSVDCFNGNNGSLRAVITGGNGNYNFKWTKVGDNSFSRTSNPVNDLEPGDYIVTVGDSRTDFTVPASYAVGNKTIDNPTQVRVTDVSVEHIKCKGENGKITVTATGGTPPYSYRLGVIGNYTDVTNNSNIWDITVDSKMSEYLYIRDAKSCEFMVVDIVTVNEPDLALTIDNISTTDNTILGGSTGAITIDIIGGTPGYTVTWQKDGVLIPNTGVSINGLFAGEYVATVVDNNDCRTASTIITIIDPLSLSVSKSNVSCFDGNDGKIILNPQGGTRPYSFSIDNKLNYISENDLTNLTIEGLVDGTYEVWLRDNGNREITIPETITIEEPIKITITQAAALEHVTTIGGTDGSITIDVMGGTGNKTFLWTKLNDPTFNRTTKDIDNLSFGVYTVVVKDENDCIVDATYEVKEPLPMKVVISETVPILCYDDALGELLATVTGGYPIDSSPSDFEYRWYQIENTIETPINTDLTLDHIENLSAGTYKVVTNDSKGASAEKIFNLLQPDDLVVTLTSAPIDVKCRGEATGVIDITVVGGPKDEDTGEYLPYTFSWTKVGDPTFKATTEDLQNITAGTYEVVVIDDNLCTTSLSQAVVIEQPDAILEIYDVNPVNLTGFQTQNGSISLEVRGGTPPYNYSWTDLDNPLYTASNQDINQLSIGRYRLIVTDKNDCTTSITQEITEPNQLIVTIQPISVDNSIQCFGEQTLVPLITNTVGGVGAYTYEWFEESDLNTVIFTTSETTTVNVGTYVVVVTDENGNKDDDTYEVTEPDKLDIGENVTHLLCRGDDNGRIDITVMGGVEPYSFSWSNGETIEDLSSLRAGNYTIIVTDANDCTFEKEIEVEQPPGLFINGDIIRVYPSSNGARDGRITVNIGGGTPPYDYEWRDFNGVVQPSTTNVLDNIGAEKYALTVTDANDCTLEIDDVDLFEPPALEVTIEQVNVISCFGTSTGSLSAIVVGGVPFNSSKQYNYQWFDADTNTITGGDSFLLEGIAAGNYYVVVTDAVSKSVPSEVFDLNQPLALELELSADFINCGDAADWTITPQINGGTAPYRYVWNNGKTSDRLENVVAGTYSLEIIDARGCRASDQITVSPPDALIVRESLNIPTCYGGCDGAIFLETEGGTPPYTYQWSNGSTTKDLNTICSGTYVATITDIKGCQIKKKIVLNDPEEFIVDLGEDITLCKDQTAILDATVDDPNATYLWTTTNGFSSTSSSIEVKDSNVYEVLVIDSKGCEARDNIFVDTTSDVISANFIASTQVFSGEEFVIVDNSDPVPESIDWIFPKEATVTYEDEHYAELIFDIPGEYEITLQTNIGLCSALTTKKVIVLDKEFEGTEGEDGSVEEIQSFIEYKVYPNPNTGGKFKVDVDLSKVQSINLKVFNMINNALIDSRKGEGGKTYSFDYDMSSLASGIYFILLETSSASQVRKLVIE